MMAQSVCVARDGKNRELELRSFMLTTLFWLAAAALSSIIIWKATDPFSDASHYLGRNIPPSVRGATIDAVASSLPELFATFLFLMVYGEYASGIATVAGSAIYNMLVIPGVCALIARSLTVSKEVVWRDGVYYLLSQIVLIGFLVLGELTWVSALVLIAMYVVYVFWLHRDAVSYQKGRQAEHEKLVQADIDVSAPDHDHEAQPDDEKGNAPQQDDERNQDNQDQPLGVTRPWTVRRAWTVVALSALVVAGSCQLLVTSCVRLSVQWEVPAYFIAVVLAAAATSVPDTVLSIFSTLKGDDSGAVSNAFGSNIFDINIGLGLPLLYYTVTTGKAIHIAGPGLTNLWLVLLAASGISLVIFGKQYRLGRVKAGLMLLVYVGFVTYVVLTAHH
ncbi:MAG: sodium:calcium antiporter [Deltaproteobacteria bacterium]|nr:sodium:calcium antiporter [Deltaproteobacteria bacterium]